MSICDNVSVVDGIFTDGFPYTKEYAVDKIIIHENLNKSSVSKLFLPVMIPLSVTKSNISSILANKNFTGYKVAILIPNQL